MLCFLIYLLRDYGTLLSHFINVRRPRLLQQRAELLGALRGWTTSMLLLGRLHEGGEHHLQWSSRVCECIFQWFKVSNRIYDHWHHFHHLLLPRLFSLWCTKIIIYFFRTIFWNESAWSIGSKDDIAGRYIVELWRWYNENDLYFQKVLQPRPP